MLLYPAGAVLREFWRYGPGDAERALHSQNPCASTGTWYLEPTPVVRCAAGHDSFVMQLALSEVGRGWHPVIAHNIPASSRYRLPFRCIPCSAGDPLHGCDARPPAQPGHSLSVGPGAVLLEGELCLLGCTAGHWLLASY